MILNFKLNINKFFTPQFHDKIIVLYFAPKVNDGLYSETKIKSISISSRVFFNFRAKSETN